MFPRLKTGTLLQENIKVKRKVYFNEVSMREKT